MVIIDGGALPDAVRTEADPGNIDLGLGFAGTAITILNRRTRTASRPRPRQRNIVGLCAARFTQIAAGLALITPFVPALATAGKMIAPAALREDLRVLVDTMEHKHPALSHSVTPARFESAANRIERQLYHPMNQMQAWAVLAQLNSVLADGHLAISLPDWRAAIAEEIKRGTGFFPFEVSVSERGYPVIVAALGGAATPLAGRRIKRINGRDARVVSRELLARTHGDTPAFRAALLSLRWAMYYSNVYGTPAVFDLVLDGTRGAQRIAASHTLPDVVQRDADFDRLYRCSVGGNGTARMTVSSFSWSDKDRYFRFTHDCFARIKAAAVTRLVIDVSQNGGGDDDFWKDGILRYIATRPYKQGSTYVKREPTGELSTGSIQSDTVPPSNEPLHYAGKVFVNIGPGTYSSAVLFSNVVKDYGFGALIGKGGFARTAQTGVKTVVLPNTGLILSFPRFVLDRPSGAREPIYLEPDAAPVASSDRMISQ